MFGRKSTATVWLPSITRAIRIQVVNGNCRKPAAAHRRDRRRRGRSRRPGARDSSPSARAMASPVSRTHSSLERSTPAAPRGQRIEAIVRVDQRDGFAACRRGREEPAQHGRPSGRSRADDLRQVARAAARRRARSSRAGTPGAARSSAVRACPRAARDVSVTSSLRARSSDSSAARAASFSLFIRLARRV